jgi:hypothetical protein
VGAFVAYQQQVSFANHEEYQAFWVACGKPPQLNTNNTAQKEIGFFYGGFFVRYSPPQ